MKVKTEVSYLYGRRAMAAFFKTWNEVQEPPQPASPVMQVEIDDKLHVVLANPTSGVIAVYRVRPDTDQLRRMKRWPRVIDKIVKGEVK
jgi:hypothetical protein